AGLCPRPGVARHRYGARIASERSGWRLLCAGHGAQRAGDVAAGAAAPAPAVTLALAVENRCPQSTLKSSPPSLEEHKEARRKSRATCDQLFLCAASCPSCLGGGSFSRSLRKRW